MLMRVLISGVLLFFCSTVSCFAWEGWVYNAEGLSFYSASIAERTNFTWDGGTVDGKPDGSGLQQFFARDGRKLGSYQGNMAKGYREGRGKLQWDDYQYDGFWHLGYFHGHGRLTWGTSLYVGEFSNGWEHGHGVRVTDGSLETGSFEKGKFMGLALHEGYFVIGLCSKDRKEAEGEATKQQQMGLHPLVIYSSEWSNLEPDLYAVIYGILESEEEVRLLDGFNFVGQIPYYIKYSGAGTSSKKN